MSGNLTKAALAAVLLASSLPASAGNPGDWTCTPVASLVGRQGMIFDAPIEEKLSVGNVTVERVKALPGGGKLFCEIMPLLVDRPDGGNVPEKLSVKAGARLRFDRSQPPCNAGAYAEDGKSVASYSHAEILFADSPIYSISCNAEEATGRQEFNGRPITNRRPATPAEISSLLGVRFY